MNEAEKEAAPLPVRSNAWLGVTGVGEWCAPGPATEQNRKWLLMFEDRDRRYALFGDETEAYLAFGKAEAMGWNCHLFAHAPRVTHNVKVRGCALLRSPSRLTG